ncbi:MAG: site-2 protease family protein, partial [Myxococcota bacterium]
MREPVPERADHAAAGQAKPPVRWLLPLALFGLTLVTTWSAGGPSFAIPLMSILLFHEFGHYIAARIHRVPASLPMFIPIPAEYSIAGTMGAVISMKDAIRSRNALLDIGAAG